MYLLNLIPNYTPNQSWPKPKQTDAIFTIKTQPPGGSKLLAEPYKMRLSYLWYMKSFSASKNSFRMALSNSFRIASSGSDLASSKASDADRADSLGDGALKQN